MDDSLQWKLWPARSLRWAVWWLFTLAWTTALLVPPSVVGWVFALFFPPPPVPVEDAKYEELKFLVAKSIHVAAFAFWAVLSAWLHLPGSGRWRLLIFLSLHAMATEFLQQFVGRTGSWQDVGLDHIGVAVGLLLSWRWWFKAA